MTKANTQSRPAAVLDVPLTVLKCRHQVTKRFELAPDGSLIKAPAVPVGQATVERYTVGSAEGLGNLLLNAMDSSQVIMLGHFQEEIEAVVPIGTSLGAGRAHRTKDCAAWSAGPQWMVLDVDKSHCLQPFQQPEDLHAKLVELAPCLDGVEMFIVSSGSSGIYTEQGAELTGYGGWHVWLRLARGTDWPDFVEWLCARCWMFGQFRHIVSASGNLLERGLIDTSVSSPERIQYSAPSVLGAGLAQLRRWGTYGDKGRELSNWKRLSADDKKLVLANKESSRHTKQEQAGEVREQWLQERKAKLVARGVDDVSAVSKALSALEGHLDDEWELILESGNSITVGELLKDRATYDGVRCKDPLEPEYQGWASVGRIFWRENGKKPLLHSFAHGGANYTLGGKVDTLSALIRDLVYVVEDKRFYSLADGRSYDRDSLNFTFANELGANATYKAMAEHQDRRVVQSRSWFPGQPKLFELEGVEHFNTCPDLTPPKALGALDVGPWVEHVRYIYGEISEWWLDHVAHMIQHPGTKPHVHPIVGSGQRVGKDLSLRPLRHWYASKGCLGSVAALPEVLDYHDQLVGVKMVVVNECAIKDLGLTERRRLSTQLKAMTVSNGPGEMLSLNVKRKDRVSQANLMAWFMFTNDPRPLELEHDDARFVFHWCREPRKADEYYAGLVEWVDDNWLDIIAWLGQRDWKANGYHPQGIAPSTKEKRDLMEERHWDDDSIIGDILDAYVGQSSAVSVHTMAKMARALGMEFKSDDSAIKVMSSKLRSYALRTGLVTDQIKGQPGGKGAATIRRTVAVLDVAGWKAVGGQNEQLRYLVNEEAKNARF